MNLTKILIALVIVLMIFVGNNLLKVEAGIYDHTGEKIQYLISPLGRSEYNDLGLVDLKGIKVNLVTVKTRILFFDDTEKIYSDPDNLLPLKVERITEEYDQNKFTVVIRKFQGEKVVNEQVIKTNGQIQNGILLPFKLRRLSLPDLKIGWSFTARFPAEFKLVLVSMDEITTPAGKFQAYHFKSIPDKFEIWINKNNPQVPLKILGKGIFGCSLLMKNYSLHSN
jgi:hypothetical protein